MNVKKWLLAAVVTGFSVAAASADQERPKELRGMGAIIQSGGVAAQCIFPVEVYQIDGKSIDTEGRLSFKLPAGRHVLRASAVVNLNGCGGSRHDIYRKPIPPLEIEVLPGRQYHIGLDAKPARKKDWRLVVWKTR